MNTINDHNLYSVWYFPGINRFIDENGCITNNVYQKLDPWAIELWKKTQSEHWLVDKNDDIIQMFYLDKELEEHMLNHAYLLA